MQALLPFATLLLRCVLALFRARSEQAIVELALRQQLAAYAHKQSKPRRTPLDRALWIALSRFWPRWKDAVVIVKPETVVRWHRKDYNAEQVHAGLGDSPDGRPIEARPSPTARIVGLPRVGGLHHRYACTEAA